MRLHRIQEKVGRELKLISSELIKVRKRLDVEGMEKGD